MERRRNQFRHRPNLGTALAGLAREPHPAGTCVHWGLQFIVGGWGLAHEKLNQLFSTYMYMYMCLLHCQWKLLGILCAFQTLFLTVLLKVAILVLVQVCKYTFFWENTLRGTRTSSRNIGKLLSRTVVKEEKLIISNTFSLWWRNGFVN